MTIANLYRQLKQILDDSNAALINRGFKQVDSLLEIPEEVKNGAGRLGLLVSKEIAEITADDFGDITTVPSRICYSCKNLTNVTIPSSVTIIGDSAFEYCDNLNRIDIYATVPPSLGYFAIPTNAFIFVPKGRGNAYQKHRDWSKHSPRIYEM